ncbi:EAL domain-containing protein [Spirulina major]|nr:EAL domain-containing protein [Spirulina major]
MLQFRDPHSRPLLRLIGAYLGIGTGLVTGVGAIANQVLQVPPAMAWLHLSFGWGAIWLSGGLAYGVLRRWTLALTQQSDYIEYLFAANPCPVWVCDARSQEFLAVNQAAIDTYGYSRAEFLQLTLWDLLTSDTSLSTTNPITHRTQDGTELTVDVTHIDCTYQNRNARLTIVQDMTPQQNAVLALQDQKVQYRTLANQVPSSAVLLIDPQLRYTFAAGTTLDRLPIDQSQIEGCTLADAFSPAACAQLEPLYRRALAGESLTTELTLDQRTFLTSLAPLYDTHGRISQAMSLVQDITDRKQLEAQLHAYAYTDPVTQLPNKAWFLEQLHDHLSACQSGNTGFFTVFFLELERFNAVKYSLGHDWAEQMMVATAERLSTCLNLADPVARVGDHSLALVLTNLHTTLDATAIAEYIHQQLNQPLEIDSQELFSSVMIGIAIIDTPDRTQQDAEDVLQAADTAMNYARFYHQANHAIFEPRMSEDAIARFSLEAQLRQAIQKQDFVVFYQPIFNIASAQLVGFEALMRWEHPELGWITPSRFIPVAEETGLMGLIDWWVLGEACRQLGQWQQHWTGATPLVLTVNVSGALLNQFGFRDRLRQVTLSNRLKRGSLKLEVTEQILFEHQTATHNILDQLKNLDVKLAVDDFGTGYSCLQHLHHLPIDTLKIDASFVNTMLDNADSLEIIRIIIALSQSLQINVIAEGIETTAQLDMLRSLHCIYGQGYLFAEPVPAAGVLPFILQNQMSHSPEP